MREQLIQYVNLLFAGVADADEIKQEILQNTLDRYDDLMDQGKTPEAAYRLAISGIGDINEILSSATATDIPQAAPQPQQSNVIGKLESIGSKALKACAIALYILCPIPVIVMEMIGMETLGLCGTLGMVAIATVMLILSRRDNGSKERTTEPTAAPETELKKSVRSLIGAIGFAVYMIVSFSTGAWHITWLIFPILGAVRGLVFAIMDLKENN